MTAGTDSINQDCDGMTALHLAAKYATVPAILHVILQAVADCGEAEQILAMKSALKQNPLHVAAKIPSDTSEAFRCELRECLKKRCHSFKYFYRQSVF